MGYTHYWYSDDTIPAGKWLDFTGAVRKVLKTGDGIIQKEYNEADKPVIDQSLVRFNGIGEDGHETFYMTRTGEKQAYIDGDRRFDFCKTARKDYDKYVTACLILARIHFPDHISVSSDGWVEEWQEGLELVNEVFGKHYEFIDYGDEDATLDDMIEKAVIREGTVSV